MRWVAAGAALAVMVCGCASPPAPHPVDRVGLSSRADDASPDRASGDRADEPRAPASTSGGGAEAACTDETFALDRPACEGFCPLVGAPVDWPPCMPCPAIASVDNPACWETMPCPSPPDRHVVACGCCVDCFGNEACERMAHQVRSRITDARSVDGVTRITLDVPSRQPVGRGWRGTVMRGEAGSDELPGGAVTLEQSSPATLVARVAISPLQLARHHRVRWLPPSRACSDADSGAPARCALPRVQVGRIVRRELVAGVMQIVVALGTEQGIDAAGWTGVVLRGDSADPLPDGALTIVRVGTTTTVATVRRTAGELAGSDRVRFAPTED